MKKHLILLFLTFFVKILTAQTYCLEPPYQSCSDSTSKIDSVLDTWITNPSLQPVVAYLTTLNNSIPHWILQHAGTGINWLGDTINGSGSYPRLITKYTDTVYKVTGATNTVSGYSHTFSVGSGDSGIATTVYSMLGYSKLVNSATKPRTLTLNTVTNSSPTISADTVAITSVNNTMSSSDTVLQISVAGVVDGGYGVTYGIDYHKTIATTTPSTGSSYHNVILTFITHASDSCIVSQGSAGITRTKSHWNTIILQGTATSIFSIAINRFGTLVKIAVSQDQQ